ncbi:hydrocephalus-inducing protein homolog [Haemorhous mexicanus]|uniref:hydrocephalus-inducing protein homolog n=1 Tax=Haemorhous mexicanus TaxID=30427 RepID=UPI0028BD339A|nr:hydrocephalus-inducing protein homolog [Haemorhous mexicanus]
MGKAARRDSSSKENQISTQRIEDPQNSSTKRSKSMLKSASVATEFLRVVFPQWRKTMKEDEVIFKEYVESTKQFHFGPLLCGKSREWYKAQNCPSNSENLTILNNSPVDVEVQFSFENAGEAETFLLDPPSMILKPKEKQELTIWAYPTSPGFLEDKLICSIGKNPDPVVFSLCCHGVDMKLEVSPLELSFDKLLLYRTASRTLVLKNNTLLPMAWQLRGLVDLIEDFSLSQDSGIIDPHTEFEVTLHFQARQTGSIEKTLRLEVSDTENILGVVQAENIKISAEVYDVSLSIDMPEAVRGNHIEFGHCPVGEPCWRALTITSHAQTKVMRFEWEADAPIQFSPKVGHLHPGWAKDITVTLRSDVPATFRRHLVKCKVTTINFELPQRKVQDWDDQMTIAMWKNTTRKDPVTRWPKIERVVKAVPEPAHTVVEESSQEVEVYISAVVAYAQFQLSTDRVQFKDTFPFQRRTATFMMHNTGEVALKYSWEKVEESEPVKKPFSTTLMRRFLSYNTAKNHKKLLRLFWWEQEDHPAERPPKVRRPAKQQQDSEKQQQQDSKQQEEQVSEQKQEQSEQQDHSKKLRCSKQKNLSPRRVISSLEVFPDVIHDLFSINPYRGTIAPGQKQTFHLQFSPKHTGKFKATLLCRIPNLEPAQKMGQVIVEGRVQEWKNLGEPLE